MAYIKPSTLVYQDLATAGGVANSTPDLEACIVGPTYNILSYVAGNTASQVKTAVSSATATTGSIASGAFALTVVSTAGFNIGDSILVEGAGSSAGVLGAIISGITGNIITLDTAAATTVTAAAVTKAGKIVDGAASNTFSIAGQKPGQVVDTGSVDIWLSNTRVETLASPFAVLPSESAITAIGTQATTAATTSGSKDITVVSAAGLALGDVVTVAGAGAAGALLTSTITNIASLVVTLADAAGTTLGSGASVKVIPKNLNSSTNTLRVESGDEVKFSYTDGVTLTVFTSVVRAVSTNSGLNGAFIGITLTDSLPATAVGATVTVSVIKTYQDQLLNAVKPISGGANYSTATIGTTGQVTINAGVELSYGPVVSSDVYVAYRALRTDLSNRVLTINDALDLVGQLGEISDANPLALAIQLALANTTGRIRAIAVDSDDLLGHQIALTIAEGERLYFLAPLTQDPAIIAAYKAHAVQMSTPENASWRVTIANTAVALEENIGTYSSGFVNANGGNNAVTLVSTKYVLTASNATFITDGVTPGDIVHFSAATPSGQVGAHQVLEVVSNQQLVLDTTATSTAVSYYVTRTLNKTQSAQSVAATSSGFNVSRVIHVQPDIVGVSINGVTTYVPGYYLCAALAGMGAGFPVQQGFTNIGVAGITDLKHSNFYFSKDDLNTMAAAGTCLFVQDSQGGIPYCRHELTTDMSVLEYREIMKVKNWDFLSYYFHDKVKMFTGVWNITNDSINTVRQTLIASAELVKTKKLPKIGAPLTGYTITSLQQNAVNKDNLDVYMSISMGDPLNYLNLHLVV